jgi:hypothetical protein
MRQGKAIKDMLNALSIGKLNETKKHALRRGVWFKALNRVERGIIDLTVRYVDTVKSTALAKVLTAIIEKLQQTMETFTDKMIRTVGLPLARKISDIAVSWGNHLAKLWAEDHAFARFLVTNFAKTTFDRRLNSRL